MIQEEEEATAEKKTNQSKTPESETPQTTGEEKEE
jgi:hypothetical protein